MTPKQEEALRDYLQEAITPLIEQVLVKKLGQAMSFAAEQSVKSKREWVGLSDSDKLHYIKNMHRWTTVQLFDFIERDLKEKNYDFSDS